MLGLTHLYRESLLVLHWKVCSPKETRILNFFSIITISYLFLYILVTYRWKGLKERYNFIIESTSIRIHMKKSHQGHGCFLIDLSAFLSRGHWCSLEQHKFFFLEGHDCSLGQFRSFLLMGHEKLLRANGQPCA